MKTDLDFRTGLSESGHTWLCEAARVHRVNRRLAAAGERVGPLQLTGSSLGIRHLHIGPGRYLTGSGAGMHEHAQLQIEYVVSGRFHFETSDRRLDLIPGQGMVLLPGQPHSWACRHGGHMIGGLLDLTGARRHQFLEHLSRSQPATSPVIDGARPAELVQRLLPLLASDPQTPWLHEHTGFLTGLWLIAILSQAWPLDRWIDQDRAADSEDALCLHARQFMADNCTRPIHLEEVALEVGVSVRHLNRLYGRHLGESPGAALARLRLEAARRLVVDDNLPIKTVARTCGYATPAYFTACYRKRYGETPSATRRGTTGGNPR